MIGVWEDTEEESYIVSPKTAINDDDFERLFVTLLTGDGITWGFQYAGILKCCDTQGLILLGTDFLRTSPYILKTKYRTPLRQGYIGPGYTRLRYGPPGTPKADNQAWGSTLPAAAGTKRDRRSFCVLADERGFVRKLFDRLMGTPT